MTDSGNSGREAVSAETLTGLEIGAIDLFVRIAQLFGVSKSIGEIYGFLFVSTGPVSVEDVRNVLKMSTGSASQGLRLLRSVGAVRTTYVAGDRRDYYVAETGLRKIAAGFLREKVAPHLTDQDERVARLGQLLDEIPTINRAVLGERIRILQGWRRQAKAVLPLVMNGLEIGEKSPVGGALE